MEEYIKREDALKAARKACGSWIEMCDGGPCENYEAIFNVPAADVAPVVRARWDEGIIWRKDCFWVCSNCKFPSEASAAPKLYKYCPNCGAKMDLEVETDAAD